jgi:hypothetical protein
LKWAIYAWIGEGSHSLAYFMRQNRKKREIKTNQGQKCREQEYFAGNAEFLPFWMQNAVGGCGEVKFKESLNVSFA